MNYQIVRVELHNADSADYTKLHENMAAAGFKRQIKGKNGHMYDLPSSEYIRTSTYIETADDIRDKVKSLIPTGIAKYWLLVSCTDDVAFWLTQA